MSKILLKYIFDIEIINKNFNLFFNTKFPESGVYFTLTSGPPHFTSHLWLGGYHDPRAPLCLLIPPLRYSCENPYSLLVIRCPAHTTRGRPHII